MPDLNGWICSVGRDPQRPYYNGYTAHSLIDTTSEKQHHFY